jgi:hypothetical protein
LDGLIWFKRRNINNRCDRPSQQFNRLSWFTDIPQDNDYTIIKETRGLIEDYHFGESGHKYLFDIFHNQLKINKNILFNLWEK